jgi:serine/threonine protein kinase
LQRIRIAKRCVEASAAASYSNNIVAIHEVAFIRDTSTGDGFVEGKVCLPRRAVRCHRAPLAMSNASPRPSNMRTSAVHRDLKPSNILLDASIGRA